ncbi:MAG: cytochrome c maturation protein CcmE domain-containing protein [Candidatus Thorarchaeota archaeon]
MKKKTRMMLIAGVLIVVVGIVAYGMLNFFVDPYISVDSVTENPEAYMGRTIQVKGNLQPESISITGSNVTLVLEGNTSTILVLVETQLPSLTDGQEMVAIGVLEEGEQLIIRASEILSKCPSKYEAAP